MRQAGSPTTVRDPEVTGALEAQSPLANQLKHARPTLGNQMLSLMLMLIIMSMVMLHSPWMMMMMESLQKEAHPTMRNLKLLGALCAR